MLATHLVGFDDGVETAGDGVGTAGDGVGMAGNGVGMAGNGVELAGDGVEMWWLVSVTSAGTSHEVTQRQYTSNCRRCERNST